MHKHLDPRHLFISSIFLLVGAYAVSAFFLMNGVLSIWASFFFCLLGIFLFIFSVGAFLQEQHQSRVLAARELLLVAIIMFVVTFIIKGYFGGVFAILGVMTLLFSISTIHYEKHAKKHKVKSKAIKASKSKSRKKK